MPEQVLPKRRLRISWLQRTRQLYILPTRYGALYACMLLAMLAGAINYTLSLGFALTFLLAGLGLVAMLHAWRNLAGITLEIAKAEPVFAGHRIYQLGDSPKRVDWKASSREQGLLIKQYHGAAQRTLWLDWEATPGADAEQRISQLTRWVIDADACGLRYGLRLPAQTLAPDTGEHHYRRCLQALALMD